MEYVYSRALELELESLYNRFVDWKIFYPYEDFRDIFDIDSGSLTIKHRDGSDTFNYYESKIFMQGVYLGYIFSQTL